MDQDPPKHMKSVKGLHSAPLRSNTSVDTPQIQALDVDQINQRLQRIETKLEKFAPREQLPDSNQTVIAHLASLKDRLEVGRVAGSRLCTLL